MTMTYRTPLHGITAFLHSIDLRTKTIIWRLKRFGRPEGPLAVINRLPVEILAEVFLYLVCSCQSNRGYLAFWRRSSSPYSWLSILQVCRYWCQVALQEPTLWKDVHITGSMGVDFVEMVLARSGNGPLTLHTHMLSPPNESTVKLVMAKAGRLRSVELFSSENSGDEWGLSDSRPQLMPLLNKLSLCSSVDRKSLPLPTFFRKGGPYPVLKSLSLFGVSITPTSPLWVPSLTSFHLTGPAAAPTPLSCIIMALSQLPNLQVLELRTFSHRLEPPSSITVSPLIAIGGRLSLPHLRYLQLGAELLPCTHLLERLAFPANTRASFKLSEGLEGGDIPTLSGVLVPLLFGENRLGIMPELRTCEWACDLHIPAPSVTCCLWREYCEDPTLGNFGQPPFLRLAIDSRSHDLQVLSRMFASFPLHDIRCLVLRPAFKYQHHANDWSALLCATPKVEVLHICVSHRDEPLLIAEVNEVLGRRQLSLLERTGYSDTQREAFLLPHLKRLILEGIYFTTPLTAGGSAVDGLFEVIRKRREVGMPLEKVVLILCGNVNARDQERLRAAMDGMCGD